MRYSRVWTYLYLTLLAAFLYLPVMALVLYSFNDSALSAQWRGWTWRWYAALWDDHRLGMAAVRSAMVGGVTVAATLPLALGAALFFRSRGRMKSSGHSAFNLAQTSFWGLVLTCLVLPDLVLGLGFLVAFSLLGWPLGWLSLIAAHVTFSLPFAFLVLRSRLTGEGRILEEAAADLGATPGQIFWRVTLPAAAPGLWAAGFLVWTLSLDDVVVSFFTAGPDTTTLPLHIHGLLRLGLQPKVNALYTVLLGSGLVLFLLGLGVKAMVSMKKNRPSRLLGTRTGAVGAILLALIGVMGMSACQKTPPATLNIYNWPDYIDPAVVTAFEKETGSRVNYDTYSSNEELVAKLQAGASGYDVVFPSDYAVQQLSQQKLLRALPAESIPNAKHLDPRFRHLPFDTAAQFSIPFMWGTLGIGYNAKRVQPPPRSWMDLFDSSHAGRIAMLDSHRDVIACALKALGHSMNSVDSAALNQAAELLLRQKPWVRLYSTEGYRSALVSGEVDLALAWPGDVLQAAKDNPDLKYVVPVEGTNLWMDNMAVAVSAPHPELAYRFIDFLLRPENNVQVSRKIFYATPNLAAQALLTEEEKQNQTIYPPQDVIRQSEWFIELGDKAPLWDAVWSRVKGGG